MDSTLNNRLGISDAIVVAQVCQGRRQEFDRGHHYFLLAVAEGGGAIAIFGLWSK